MIITFDNLVSATERVRSIVSDNKASQPIMLKITTDTIDFCYSDGKSSIIKKVSYTKEDGDTEKNIIIKLDKLEDIIGLCTPGSKLKTDDVHVSLCENSMFKVETTKYYELYDGTTDADENPVIVKKVVSKVEKAIGYLEVDADVRFAMTSRVDYDGIFKFEEGIVWDKWDRTTLLEVIRRVSKNDIQVGFVSAKTKSAFAVNGDKTTVTTLNIEDNPEEDFYLTNGFSISGKIAKYLVEILSKTSDEKIYILTSEKRYCSLISESLDLGIHFEMSPAKTFETATVDRYKNWKYESHRTVFNRFALVDFIKGVLTSDKADDAEIKYGIKDGLLDISTKRGRSDNSDVGLSLSAESYTDKDGTINGKSITLNFKLLNNLIGNCKEDFVVLDYGVDPAGTFIQISDSCGMTENGEVVASAIHYMASK